MNESREIYWNVGHSVQIPMYLLAIIAISILAYGFYKRYQVYKIGKPEDRFDNKYKRIIYFLSNAFGQKKVLNVFSIGSIHALFFWSFLILFIGTTLIFIQADFLNPIFGIEFLKGSFYKIFSLFLDIAGLLAIIMVLFFAIRRYIFRPEGLETTIEDIITHILLLLILISGFIVEGLRMAQTEISLESNLALFSPVGLFIAKIFTSFSESTILIGHKFLWWFHFLCSITFIASIPFLKLRHIFTTSINYLFKDYGPKGNLPLLDIEDENREVFGVDDVKEYSWKDIYDSDACTKCKRCQDRCPAYATNKPLSPMKVVNDINTVAFGENKEGSLIDTVGEDSIWACTTCMACQEICPADIEHIRKIIDMRRYMVLMDGKFPGEEVQMSINNIEVNSNPFGNAFAERDKWSENTEVKLLSEDSDVDVMYFVGCYASYDQRNIKIAKSFVNICSKAGIKVGIMGSEEKCCGDPARKMGNEYLYQMIANENIENIKKYNVKKVVTTCPHCFNTLNKDYRDLGLDVEVVFYINFIKELIDGKKLTLTKNTFGCTYHDSCYIGRYNNIYDEQRYIIRTLGGNVKEMEKSRNNSFCCGGGGGRIIAEEKLGERINLTRIKMAKDVGESILVSNCPFCMTMFEEGIKLAGYEDMMYVKDLAEIINEHIQ
ncbi:MAG: heterodisulfide reductase-related iron-sulfur binding cluster [Deferribacterota bacterium]|nr:heterodisulfide reductase-related iron-sulfur binding cluster [Deferribacterota bacterium]